MIPLGKKFVAEILGTFLLVFFGTGAVVVTLALVNGTLTPNVFNTGITMADWLAINAVFGIYSGLVLSIIMTLPISSPFWNMFSFMSFFQFPWRFLILVAFFISLAGGLCVYIFEILFAGIKFKPYILSLICLVIIVITLFTDAKLFRPQTIYSVDDSFYLNRTNLLWTTSKTSDEYMPQGFYKPKNKVEALRYNLISTSGQILVKNLQRSTNKIEFTAFSFSLRKQEILVHLAPFSGWKNFIWMV